MSKTPRPREFTLESKSKHEVVLIMWQHFMLNNVCPTSQALRNQSFKFGSVFGAKLYFFKVDDTKTVTLSTKHAYHYWILEFQGSNP